MTTLRHTSLGISFLRARNCALALFTSPTRQKFSHLVIDSRLHSHNLVETVGILKSAAMASPSTLVVDESTIDDSLMNVNNPFCPVGSPRQLNFHSKKYRCLAGRIDTRTEGEHGNIIAFRAIHRFGKYGNWHAAKADLINMFLTRMYKGRFWLELQLEGNRSFYVGWAGGHLQQLWSFPKDFMTHRKVRVPLSQAPWRQLIILDQPQVAEIHWEEGANVLCARYRQIEHQIAGRLVAG